MSSVNNLTHTITLNDYKAQRDLFKQKRRIKKSDSAHELALENIQMELETLNRSSYHSVVKRNTRRNTEDSKSIDTLLELTTKTNKLLKKTSFNAAVRRPTHSKSKSIIQSPQKTQKISSNKRSNIPSVLYPKMGRICQRKQMTTKMSVQRILEASLSQSKNGERIQLC